VFERFDGTDLPRKASEQFKIGQRVRKNSLRYGDLVFFKINGRSISHVGIYIGHDEFVHASYSSGVVISHIDEKYWQKRFAGARRIIP
jgi:cell wall-associated NlpC family hydrolase